MLKEFDISHEIWREYDFTGGGVHRIYRIENPKLLFIREGGSTHRIVDANGVTHLCPGPGFRGCIIRWKNPPGEKPVNF